MKKPSSPALFLAMVPYLALCFSVPAWDRVYPMIFGLPFNFAWVLAWTLLTPACMWGAYRVESSRAAKTSNDRNRGEQQR